MFTQEYILKLEKSYLKELKEKNNIISVLQTDVKSLKNKIKNTRQLELPFYETDHTIF